MISAVSKQAVAVADIPVMVFKTNIRFKKDLKAVGGILDAHPRISRWNVDLGDIDKVLRIESAELGSEAVISMIRLKGYFCEELPD